MISYVYDILYDIVQLEDCTMIQYTISHVIFKIGQVDTQCPDSCKQDAISTFFFQNLF